jgi:hypothetical protein
MNSTASTTETLDHDGELTNYKDSYAGAYVLKPPPGQYRTPRREPIDFQALEKQAVDSFLEHPETALLSYEDRKKIYDWSRGKMYTTSFILRHVNDILHPDDMYRELFPAFSTLNASSPPEKIPFSSTQENEDNLFE